LYLLQHHQVDICLDAFPYGGGTTSLHALWMGVPTITMPGLTVASRTGASILSHAGLESFVAHDKPDFVRKALHWAGDLSALANLRSDMRERCMQSPNFRPEIIAAGMSRTLRTMWRNWCEGLQPTHLNVTRNDD
jgi:predicted O-linked N-acetylglucosamine transferase (SPINDLY family)